MNLVKLKKIDFYAQLFLICTSIIFIVTDVEDVPFANLRINFLNSLYLIGSFQIISSIFWLIISFKKNIKARQVYFFAITIVTFIGIIVANNKFEEVENLLVFIVFVSPLLAIAYLLITYTEMKILKKNKPTPNSSYS